MFEGVVRFVQRVQYLRRTLLEPSAEPDLSPQNMGRLRALLSPEEKAEVKRLVKGGRKIEAIKIFRGASGAGLVEAKAGVEAIAAAENET